MRLWSDRFSFISIYRNLSSYKSNRFIIINVALTLHKNTQFADKKKQSFYFIHFDGYCIYLYTYLGEEWNHILKNTSKKKKKNQ